MLTTSPSVTTRSRSGRTRVWIAGLTATLALSACADEETTGAGPSAGTTAAAATAVAETAATSVASTAASTAAVTSVRRTVPPLVVDPTLGIRELNVTSLSGAAVLAVDVQGATDAAGAMSYPCSERATFGDLPRAGTVGSFSTATVTVANRFAQTDGSPRWLEAIQSAGGCRFTRANGTTDQFSTVSQGTVPEYELWSINHTMQLSDGTSRLAVDVYLRAGITVGAMTCASKTSTPALTACAGVLALFYQRFKEITKA